MLKVKVEMFIRCIWIRCSAPLPFPPPTPLPPPHKNIKAMEGYSDASGMSSCTSVRMRPRSNDKLSRLETKIKLNARLPIGQKADLFGANILANKISLPRARPRAGATLKENTCCKSSIKTPGGLIYFKPF